MIPSLNSQGLLPAGVHFAADFAEVAETFGTTPDRRQLLRNLEQWAAAELGLVSDCVEAIIISGSFVTSKAAPADIDCTVVVDPGSTLCEQLRSDARRINAQYRVDVLPNAGVFLQFVGDKSARLHGCHATDLRGVISIAAWHRDTEQTQLLERYATMMSG